MLRYLSSSFYCLLQNVTIFCSNIQIKLTLAGQRQILAPRLPLLLSQLLACPSLGNIWYIIEMQLETLNKFHKPIIIQLKTVRDP